MEQWKIMIINSLPIKYGCNYKNVMQNGVNSLSKMVFKNLVFQCSKIYCNPTRVTRLNFAPNMVIPISLNEKGLTLNLSLFKYGNALALKKRWAYVFNLMMHWSTKQVLQRQTIALIILTWIHIEQNSFCSCVWFSRLDFGDEDFVCDSRTSNS